MRRLVLAMTGLCFSLGAAASTVGLSTHPFTMNKKVITTEFNSFLSEGAGMGITAKYFQRISPKLNMDAGVTVSDGDRESIVQAGADYQIFPDYGRQPRVSVKGLLETASIEGNRINTFGAAPTISKGFSFWGKEGFPFLALPLTVSLNTDFGTYETSSALAAGITGRLPLNGFDNLIGNLETNIGIDDSYTAILMGVSMPLQ